MCLHAELTVRTLHTQLPDRFVGLICCPFLCTLAYYMAFCAMHDSECAAEALKPKAEVNGGVEALCSPAEVMQLITVPVATMSQQLLHQRPIQLLVLLATGRPDCGTRRPERDPLCVVVNSAFFGELTRYCCTLPLDKYAHVG